MSRLYSSFEGDQKLEKFGIWLDYGSFRVLAAYAGGANKAYLKSIETRTKHLRRAIASGSVPNDLLQTILIDVYVETIILGWETMDENTGEMVQGIEDKEGNILPFNQENVRKTLKNLPNLFLNIQDAVSSATNYRKEQLDTEGKN